ncbi:SDR family oxidoreductase [Sphingobium aromaticiconvertens]|uniref:SDR family oxidoreductase n=1 Tax=Sphingobium aromaticiconvertens TaxID=365341 RepID=UPI00301B3C93
MDLGIAGKVALVTGGSHGIGRSIADELGRNGCRVVVVARGQERIDETVDAIRAAGGQAAGVSADLLELDSYPRMVARATELFDAPDIAIFTPVAPPSGMFSDFADADFQTAFHNVVTSFAHFVRAVSPAMKERQWGRIVTVGSGHGRLPGRRGTLGFDYVLANTVRPSGLGLSRSIADELAPHGITVNTVPPGFIDTGAAYDDFFSVCANTVGQTLEQFKTDLINRIPMKRFGTPDEVAGLCAFLCSARASYITGQYWLVDGGRMEIYY